MRGILRILAISVVSVIMTGTAYLAGFGTSWLMNQQMDVTDVAQAIGQTGQPAEDRPDGFDVFWEAWRIVQREFYGKAPESQDMTYGAIRGVLDTLNDPNTLLIDPETAEVQRTRLEGEFEGIGAYVSMNEDDQLVIVSPMEGQPAMEAGLKAGDIILEVDGQNIAGMSLTDAVLLIRGPRGTTVKITVLRSEEKSPRAFEVTRGRIEVPTVTHRTLEEAPEIGYLRLVEFGERSIEELRDAIRDLQDEGAEAYILDIRNNPGGFLRSAIEVTSQFVGGRAVLVTEQWSDGREQKFRAQRGGLLTDPDIPLVVLVNKGSASASEILAGAIQDTGRGTLVGEETFGKGAVQNVYNLSDQSQLNVTIAHWLTPNGDDIHGHGILPDIVVTLTEEQIEAQEDVQLERAIEVLQKQIGED